MRGGADPFRGGDPGPFRAPGIPRIPTNISLSEAEALRDAAYGEALEIGSAFGFSTVVIALRASRLIAVDPHVEFSSRERLIEHLGHYGVSDRVELINARSEDFLPRLVGPRFDFAFIDGNHSLLTASNDINHALRLVKPGGTIAVHDYSKEHWPSVVQAVDERLAPAVAHFKVKGTLYVAQLSPVRSNPT